MPAKTQVEIIQEFGQATLSLTPVIILGSGASAAHKIPGMWALGQHLLALDQPTSWLINENTEWNNFCQHLNTGTDLETALGRVRLTNRQVSHVATATRDFLLPADERTFEELLYNRQILPLTRLYRHLFASTHKVLDVVTPNYDRIAEYAADAGEFGCFTGFSHGYLQVRSKERGREIQGTHASRTVCVWKVHGSLDWFRDRQNRIVGARVFRSTPIDHVPLMITPGIDKYRLAHTEPFRTIFSCSDAALEKARSYLCVGYGFNDEHLQTKLVERCEAFSVPLVIITKSLTPTAKAFLNGGRCRRYLAIEEEGSGSRAYTHTLPDGFYIDNNAIWQFEKFLDFTIGTVA